MALQHIKQRTRRLLRDTGKFSESELIGGMQQAGFFSQDQAVEVDFDDTIQLAMAGQDKKETYIKVCALHDQSKIGYYIRKIDLIDKFTNRNKPDSAAIRHLRVLDQDPGKKNRQRVHEETFEPNEQQLLRWSKNSQYQEKFRIYHHGHNDDDHGKNRVVVSYRYLLMLRKLMTEGKVKGQVAQHGNTVQNKAPKGVEKAYKKAYKKKPGEKNVSVEEAHQLMTELTVDGRVLYSHFGLTVEEKRALIFLNSAVSVIHKKFNKVDNHLETHGRQWFVDFAKEIMNHGETIDQSMIFATVAQIFLNAALAARYSIRESQAPDELEFKADMLAINEGHIKTFDELKSKSMELGEKTVEDHIVDIQAAFEYKR